MDHEDVFVVIGAIFIIMFLLLTGGAIRGGIVERNMQVGAVEAGVAEWTVENGRRVFKWVTCDE